MNTKIGYDRWSQVYDEYPNPTIACDEIYFPPTWKHLSGKTILEIGCGTGRHTEKLLALGNDVVGIDNSIGMLKIAKQKCSGKKLQLIAADFLTYQGFNPNSFDAVISSLVIEHIQDIESLFSKFSTILKPGGDFFLSEIHPLKAAKGGRAHFKDPLTQEEVYLDSFAHTQEAIERAAESANFQLIYERDIFGDEVLVKLRQEWARYLHVPMIKIWVFRACCH